MSINDLVDSSTLRQEIERLKQEIHLLEEELTLRHIQSTGHKAMVVEPKLEFINNQSVFFAGFTSNCASEHIKSCFGPLSDEITKFRRLLQSDGTPKGSGFIEFSTVGFAEQAQKLTGTTLSDGRTLYVTSKRTSNPSKKKQ